MSEGAGGTPGESNQEEVSVSRAGWKIDGRPRPNALLQMSY